ncbi:MAG: hypothetical protein K9M75_11640, partial [Phycisphaerae bacterium]|nr:hypothetical protein [Phycisphaerae bacterium]
DEISYIHDQARDIISYSLSHYKTENGDISIMAPEIHKLLTQLAAELREVKTKWPIAELEPSATETETVRTSSTPPDKHELTDTERNILDALNDKTIRGRNLLKKAGYDYSSHYRGTLSNLIKRGILANHGKGYFKPTDDACHD